MIESGKRVKFVTKFIRKEVLRDEKLKEMICWCKELHEKGFMLPDSIDGKSSGNLSCRVEDGFIITASGLVSKDNLANESFVKIPFRENHNLIDLVENLCYGRNKFSIPKKSEVHCIGVREPSSETILHLACYTLRKNTGAIAHGHSEEVLKLSSKKKIVETEREDEFGSIELVESVLKVLKNNKKIDFFVLKNHGFISIGKNLEEVGSHIMKFQ